MAVIAKMYYQKLSLNIMVLTVFSGLSNLPDAVLFNNPQYCDYLCFQQLVEGIATMRYLLTKITL